MRAPYAGCPGELLELVLAPLVFQCLTTDGVDDCIASLCKRVGIEDIEPKPTNLEEVMEVLNNRWKSCERYIGFQKIDEENRAKDLIANEFESKGSSLLSRVDWICVFFEQDHLFEAAYALSLMYTRLNKLPCVFRDAYEGCLLHHVASSDGARLLIDLLPCHSLIQEQQREGFTPLHHAGSKVADFLITRGANVDVKSRSGLTPLFVVNTAPTTLTLLKHGANPSTTNTYNHSPLHLATSHGLWDVVWCLLRGGADSTSRGQDGYTPLQLCNKLLSLPITSDFQQNLRALIKVKKMLEIWDECKIEATTASLLGEAAVNIRFEVFEQRCSAAVHAYICKDPTSGIGNATNLPIELTRIILYQYIGVFTGSRDLMEKTSEFLPRNRLRYRTNLTLQSERPTFTSWMRGLVDPQDYTELCFMGIVICIGVLVARYL